jgi:hypothetical protein
MTTMISNIQSRRKEMQEWLANEPDEDIVAKVIQFKEKLYAKMKPISDTEYRESILRAIAQAEAGDLTSQEDFEKEIEKW